MRLTKEQDQLLGVGLIALWAVWTIIRYWNNWSIDLTALFFAARFFDSGDARLVYNLALEPEWEQLRDALGAEGRTLAPYIYPPWIAGLFAPFAKAVGPSGFFNASYIVNVTSMAASVLVAARLWRPASLPLLAWCGVSVVLLETSFVSRFSLDLNQPQNFVNALVLGAILFSVRGRGNWAGVLLALAAAIKLAPAVFVVVFLVRRDWRSTFVFGCVFASLGAIGALLTPDAYLSAYGETLSRLSDHVLLGRVNHSAETLIYMLWAATTDGGLLDFDGFAWVPAPAWVGTMAHAVLLGGVGVSLWVTRGLGDNALWFQVILIALVSGFAGPMGWTHYLMLPLLVAPGVIGVLGLRPGLITLVIFSLPFQYNVFVRLTARDLPDFTSSLWGMVWQMAAIGGLWLLARRSRNPRT